MTLERILKVIYKLTDDDTIKAIINSVNENQEASKNWLVQQAEPYIKTLTRPKILVAAGWFGNLGAKLAQFGQVMSIDQDPICKTLGRKLNPNVSFLKKRIQSKTLEVGAYDILVCTSCEHITDEVLRKFINRRKEGSLVILQSNDYYKIKEHINCKDSLKDFAEGLPLDRILWKGELKLKNYTRFMVIGE